MIAEAFIVSFLPKWREWFQRWKGIVAMGHAAKQVFAIWTISVVHCGHLRRCGAGGISWHDPGVIHEVGITVAEKNLEALRLAPREPVPARVCAFGQTYTNAMIRLKGSRGSFRPVDDGPSWTVQLGYPIPMADRLHPQKFHLNNSVEDPSFLCEQLGEHFFELAGIRAPDVSHARVSINGRQTGLHVLKESFADFLGTLGDRTQTGDGALRNDSIDGEALRELGHSFDGPRLNKAGLRLDRDHFLRFAAIEILLAHRDGYVLARNNFRIHMAGAGRDVRFTPWGMDQLFLPADLPLHPSFSAPVASEQLASENDLKAFDEVLMQTWKAWGGTAGFQKEVEVLCGKLNDSLTLGEQLRLKAKLSELRDRAKRRSDFVETTLARLRAGNPPEGSFPRRLEWRCSGADSPAVDVRKSAKDRGSVIEVVITGPSLVSWRTSLRLPNGRYVLSGRAMTRQLVSTSGGLGEFACRVIGSSVRSGKLAGNEPWRDMAMEFEVTSDREPVELALELRACSGTLELDLDSWSVGKNGL